MSKVHKDILVMMFGSASLNEVAGHPNKMMLKGILVRLDEPSTKPPNGSEGHRILVPSSVAQKRLKTLIGMGLNYSPNLDTHAQRRKVGSIQRAWIDANDLWIEAIVWKHDFPEAEKDLKQQGLGMSMEIGDVQVADTDAPVWKLTDFCFLGATVLWKKSAAYYKTHAIAAKASEQRSKTMAVKKTKKVTTMSAARIAEIATQAAIKGVSAHFGPVLRKQNATLAELATKVDGMELAAAGAVPTRTIETEADADGADEVVEVLASEDDEEACGDGAEMTTKKKVKAAKKAAAEDDDDDDDDDDDEEMEADAINHGDLEEMGDEPDSDDDDPGHMNEDASNKGNKTTVQDTVGKNVSKGVTSARLAASLKANRRLARENAALSASLGDIKKTLKKQQKQIVAASEGISRRSSVAITDPTVRAMLAKGGLDAGEMQASGQRLTVGEADALISAMGIDLPPVERMKAKNNLLAAGLMEQGAVNRGIQ